MSSLPGATRPPPRLTLVCVPGLSIGDVPPLEDTATRVVRPLGSAWPITDAAFIASVVTGLAPWRHGVGADEIADSVLRTVRPANRADLAADPIWEVLARLGVSSQVVGCQFMTAEPRSLAQLAGDTSGFGGGPDSGVTVLCDDAAPPERELPLEAIADVLGDRVLRSLNGVAGEARRRACAVVADLVRLVRTHDAATLCVGDETGLPSGSFRFVCYQAAGPLFRSPMVDRTRLSGFIARMLARLDELADASEAIIAVSSPTADARRSVAFPAVEGRQARGVLMLFGGRALTDTEIGTEALWTTDVAPSVLAAFGAPPSLEHAVDDPLRLRLTAAPPPRFTHTSLEHLSTLRTPVNRTSQAGSQHRIATK